MYTNQVPEHFTRYNILVISKTEHRSSTCGFWCSM